MQEFTENNENNKYYLFILKAEEFIKSKKGAPQSFTKIWKNICESLKVSEKDAAELVGEFHLTLTLHKKFVYMGTAKKQLWGLKQYYSLKELKKIEKRNLFYDDDDEVDLESDILDYTKMKEQKTPGNDSSNKEDAANKKNLESDKDVLLEGENTKESKSVNKA